MPSSKVFGGADYWLTRYPAVSEDTEQCGEFYEKPERK